MTQTRRRQVAAAVKAIRDFHAAGRTLHPAAAANVDSGRRSIQDSAERLGMNPDTVRKARQFADPDVGYTAAELDDLCRLITGVQSGQAGGAVFGRTHVIRILSVPKGRRKGLQDSAIRGAWSTAVLEAQIAARYGSRRDGGRKRRIPADTLGLLAQVEGQCEAWRRWHAAAEAVIADNSDFPPAARAKLGKADGAMTGLHRAVTDALAALRPRRVARKPFREAKAR